jgi:hypothetical protein
MKCSRMYASLSHSPLESLTQCRPPTPPPQSQRARRLRYRRQGINYLTNEDYAIKKIVEQRGERPMTLYKGPSSLLRALAPHYKLNKVEYLQIYNVRPRSQITLHLLIEEVNHLPSQHLSTSYTSPFPNPLFVIG